MLNESAKREKKSGEEGEIDGLFDVLSSKWKIGTRNYIIYTGGDRSVALERNACTYTYIYIYICMSRVNPSRNSIVHDAVALPRHVRAYLRTYIRVKPMTRK